MLGAIGNVLSDAATIARGVVTRVHDAAATIVLVVGTLRLDVATTVLVALGTIALSDVMSITYPHHIRPLFVNAIIKSLAHLR